MLAVVAEGEGEDRRPRLAELPDPQPGPGEVEIAVRATGLNHADLLQVRGSYPSPAGESAVPGLECAGVVDAVGEGVTGLQAGQRVMALLGGGGHATRVVAPAGQVMALPENLSFAEGAALPEACLTGWTNLVSEGGLCPGESVLITGATGGMGTLAVQLGRELGGRVIAVGRDPVRLERLRSLGADAAVEHDDRLAAAVLRLTGGRGVDLALDFVGGPHFALLLGALRPQGRLVLIGLLAGAHAEIDLAPLLGKRLRVTGSLLRPRARAEKAALVRSFAGFGLPRLADGRLRPVVAEVLPFARIDDAYRRLAAASPGGKIVLTVDPLSPGVPR